MREDGLCAHSARVHGGRPSRPPVPCSLGARTPPPVTLYLAHSPPDHASRREDALRQPPETHPWPRSQPRPLPQRPRPAHHGERERGWVGPPASRVGTAQAAELRRLGSSRCGPVQARAGASMGLHCTAHTACISARVGALTRLDRAPGGGRLSTLRPPARPSVRPPAHTGSALSQVAPSPARGAPTRRPPAARRLSRLAPALAPAAGRTRPRKPAAPQAPQQQHTAPVMDSPPTHSPVPAQQACGPRASPEPTPPAPGATREPAGRRARRARRQRHL